MEENQAWQEAKDVETPISTFKRHRTVPYRIRMALFPKKFGDMKYYCYFCAKIQEYEIKR